MPPVGESEVMKRAKAYVAEVQLQNRAQQLAWFGQKFRIRPEVLLRLIGYRADVAKRHAARGESVEALAASRPDATLWMTELFREMVHRHGYDVGSAAAEFHRPAPETVELSIPVGSRTLTLTPSRVSNLLLRKVRTGGPTVFQDLTAFVRITNPPARHATPRSKG